MDFKSAKELLGLCQQHGLPISEVMRRRECELGETTPEAVNARMVDAWAIMTAIGHPAAASPRQVHGRADRGRGRPSVCTSGTPAAVCAAGCWAGQ